MNAFRLSMLTVSLVLVGLTLTLFLSPAPALAGPQSRLVPLTPDEAADLVYMREEEKLARDVYLAMYAKWGVTVFSNITQSEQTHMDAVATLLSRYGLADPVAGMGPGQFATEHFQALYAALITQGNLSLNDALSVGAEIEEIDILDLFDCLAATIHQDIRRVYQNLESASENHLRAFVGQLVARGVTYVPRHLDAAVYDAIINP